MVRGILNNRFYLGEMAYGKSVCKSVRSKAGIAVPKKDWKVTSRYHEPLVTPEVFTCVSSFRPEQSTKWKYSTSQNYKKHPLIGKIYCDYGHSQNYKPGSKNNTHKHFWCRKQALLQIPDCCTYLNAVFLEETVLTELYQKLVCRGELIKQRESLEWFQKDELQKLWKDKKNF